MVSMYVDIRQAAELLARFSSGHGLPRVAIDIANEIANAARQSGLQFYTQYRDPVDGRLKVDKPANILGSSFWIDTDDKGLPFVRPNGYTQGETLKIILKANGHLHNPSPNDGEWVAHCVVSIEDVVMHPNFGFPKEKQDAILEAHKAAVSAKQEQLQQSESKPEQVSANQTVRNTAETTSLEKLDSTEDNVSQANESTAQRRERWLEWYGNGARGAVQRVYERELLLNPRADRSFIGKEIQKAKQQNASINQGNVMFGQLVRDGKR